MIIETVDKKSGAILFHEDEDTKNIKYLLKKVEELEQRIRVLEDKGKEDS